MTFVEENLEITEDSYIRKKIKPTHNPIVIILNVKKLQKEHSLYVVLCLFLKYKII